MLLFCIKLLLFADGRIAAVGVIDILPDCISSGRGGGSIKKRRHLCKAHSRHFVPHDSVLNPYPDGSGFFRRSGLRKKVRSGSGQQDPDPKHCIFKQTHKNSTALQLAYTNYYQSIPEGIDPEILVHINHLVYR